MTTQLVYSEKFNQHSTPSHPENSQRLTSMYTALQNTPLYKKLEVLEPEPIQEALLHEIHSPEMIEQIKQLSKDTLSWIDLDTYICKNDYQTASLAAGGLTTLCMNILNGNASNGYALVRPPGHHATKTQSMGFCLFNNAALAAHALTKLGKKILIIDHDGHHGNGTQQIFYTRNDVLYQSFHLSPHFPGTGGIQEIGFGDGIGYSINAPLSTGNGDHAITTLLDEIFLPIAREYKPDFIIISVGYDSHHTDPLGGLKCTIHLYADIIKKYQNIQPKIACTLEGGYNLNWLGKCLIAQLGQLMNHPIQIEDSTQEEPTVTPVIKELRKEMREYWTL